MKLTQRRKDKAWLLWDLLYRKHESEKNASKQYGILREAAWYGYDRMERLIEMVKEIKNEP